LHSILFVILFQFCKRAPILKKKEIINTKNKIEKEIFIKAEKAKI